jgi:hypothetical protein
MKICNDVHEIGSLSIFSTKIRQSLAEVHDGVVIGGGQQSHKLAFTSEQRSRQNHDIFFGIELLAEIIDVLDLVVEAVHIYADSCIDGSRRLSFLEMGSQRSKSLIEGDEVFLDESDLSFHAWFVEGVVDDGGDTALCNHIGSWND